MSASVIINDREVLLGLGGFRASLADRAAMYNILGQLMMASIAMTFREEGSPAGSWPKLALSTLSRKGFKAHKLLYLSGRLFKSIKAMTRGEALVIGPGENIPYAPVQQFGSADRRGGSVGPQARIAGRDVEVAAHSFQREREIHYTTREVMGEYGELHNVPTPMRTGKHVTVDKNGKQRTVDARYQGPRNLVSGMVTLHRRFQNISARPYLVFRPDDPANIVEALDRYIALHAPAGSVA